MKKTITMALFWCALISGFITALACICLFGTLNARGDTRNTIPVDTGGNADSDGTYIIRFHDDFEIGNDKIYEMKVSLYESVLLPEPLWEHEGYSFAGWYTADAGTNHALANVYSAGNKVRALGLEGEAVELYAGWQTIEYKISYDYAGGYATGENPHSYTIESGDISLIAPRRTGYSFLGWVSINDDISSDGTDSREDAIEKNKDENAGASENGDNMTKASEQEPLVDMKIPKGSTGDRSYKAVWDPRADTKYTVIHEILDDDGSGYKVKEIESFEGATDTDVTPATRSYEGYVSPESQTIKVRADGTSMVIYKYAREAIELEDGDVVVMHSYKMPSLVMDVEGGSLGRTANIRLYTENGTDAQKFIVTKNDDGSITLTSFRSGLNFDVYGAITDEGSNIWQYDTNGTTAQKWRVKSGPGNAYIMLTNIADDSAAVTCEKGLFSGSNICVKNLANNSLQQWKPEVVGKIKLTAGKYKILSALSDKMLLGAKSDDDLQYALLINEEESDAFNFLVEYGVSGTYRFKTTGGFYLDVQWNGKENGTPLWLYAFNNSRAQNFIAVNNEDGTYSFAASGSGKYIDVRGGYTKPGTKIQIFEGNATDAQKWSLKKS